MEPGHEQTQQYGSPGQAAPGQRDAQPAKPVRAKDAMARGRTGLVVLIAFLTELIVIAAADNQWVSDKITHLRIDPSSRIQEGLRAVGVVFAWRFTPQHGDTTHQWAGSLALIGTTFVLSLLLIMAVVRGPVTFGRAFFGSWMAVVVATFIGGYVRGLVVDLQVPGQGSRFEQALFGVLAPTSVTFIAGVGLGLIVAIIVGIVAPLTRRAPVVPLETAAPVGATPAPAGGEGFFSGSQDYPPWREERFGPPPPSNVTVGNDQPTTALPSFDRPPEQGFPPPGQSDAPTTAMPVGGPGERHDADTPTTALTPAESRDRESTQPHEPFATRSQTPGQPEAHEPVTTPEPAAPSETPRGYGDAPQSPYAPNVGAARSPAQEQSAAQGAPERTPEQGGREQGGAEPKMAEPEPPQAPTSAQSERAAEPENVPEGAGPQGTAELPRVPEPGQDGGQFPRPPDDEEIDPEHH